MKIHSDILTQRELFDALAAAKAAGKVHDGVRLRTFDAGSRQRRRAWECVLTWRGVKRPGDGRRRRQGWLWDLGDPWAAFYAERRWWLAELFEMDGRAVCGPYKGRMNFHRMTRQEFNRAAQGTQERHVMLPPGAARFVPADADAELRFRLTGDPMTRELAAEREMVEWWAGQAKRAWERGQSTA